MNRFKRYFGGLLGLALVAGAVSAWCYHTSRPDYRLRQGQEALYRGDIERAERLAERLADAGDPDRAHLLRGQIFLHQRQLNKAIREYNQIRPDREEVLVEASLIYGLGFLSLRIADRAEKLLGYVASVRPDNVDAHRGLGALYYDRGAMNEALIHLQKWSQLDDHDGMPHRFMGLIYKDLPDDHEAIEHYRAALSRPLPPPVRAEVVIELAEMLTQQMEYAEALTYLDAEFGPAGGPPAVAELRAECLYNQGRAAEAARVLEQAPGPDPASPRRLRLQAQLHADAGDVSMAAALLERALQTDPHDCACRYQLVMVYERLGRRTAAAEQRRLLAQTQQWFQELSQLNHEAILKPRDAAVRRRVAALCERLGKPEQAKMWLRAAAACPHDGPPALGVLGASTIGLLGSPLGQGPLLAAAALHPERPASPPP